jgi:CYTH domain-containing protein
METTKNRVEILKGDLIRFRINEREITWTIDNFLSENNGLLIFDFFGIKSIKPEEYEVIRNGNVINQ